MIQIAVKNESTAISDADVRVMLPAFDRQWNQDLASVWSVEQATFTYVSSDLPAGSWWVVFLDDSDQANALAYHDLTDQGLPISKVFVRTILNDRASVSVGATHELCEMAVDPWLNSAYQDQNGVFWAGEICDPVEDDQYGYKIGDILVTDFVTPDWFAHKYSQSNADFQNHAQNPFQILTGGYAQRFDPQQGWVQVTGSRARRWGRARAQEGSRRERRARSWHLWHVSEAGMMRSR
jgi:hypothetical protein